MAYIKYGDSDKIHQIVKLKSLPNNLLIAMVYRCIMILRGNILIHVSQVTSNISTFMTVIDHNTESINVVIPHVISKSMITGSVLQISISTYSITTFLVIRTNALIIMDSGKV